MAHCVTIEGPALTIAMKLDRKTWFQEERPCIFIHIPPSYFSFHEA